MRIIFQRIILYISQLAFSLCWHDMCLLSGMKMSVHIALTFLALMVVGVSYAVALDVEVNAQKYRVRPGEVFPVEYVVSWEGNPHDYAVLPPTLTEQAWGSAELLEIRTLSQGTRQEVRVIVGYYADEPGDFEIPSLQVRVAEVGESTENSIVALESDAPTQVLDAPPIMMHVRHSRVFIWLGGVFVAICALLGVLYFQARKRAVQTQVSEPTSREQAQRMLHEARKHRLDGDFYQHYRALARALDLIAEEEPVEAALRERIGNRIDDTGYRGRRPADDELDGDFRDVERIITLFTQRVSKET